MDFRAVLLRFFGGPTFTPARLAFDSPNRDRLLCGAGAVFSFANVSDLLANVLSGLG